MKQGLIKRKGFVRLKSKMYTFITEDSHESKKAKHINKADFDNELKITKNFYSINMRHEMKKYSKDHDIGSYRIHNFFFFLL